MTVDDRTDDPEAENALADALLMTYGVSHATGEFTSARDRVRPQVFEVIGHLRDAGYVIEKVCDSCGRRGWMVCGSCDNDE